MLFTQISFYHGKNSQVNHVCDFSQNVVYPGALVQNFTRMSQEFSKEGYNLLIAGIS